MVSRIVYLGGVHGVGKTTFCRAYAARLGLVPVTSSELIYEKLPAAIGPDKRVPDLELNQRLLVEALAEKKRLVPNLLIDGHFTFASLEGPILRMSAYVFDAIEPRLLAVLQDEPEKIFERLQKRSQSGLMAQQVARLQEEEREYAKEVAERLHVPCLLLSLGKEPEKVLGDVLNNP